MSQPIAPAFVVIPCPTNVNPCFNVQQPPIGPVNPCPAFNMIMVDLTFSTFPAVGDQVRNTHINALVADINRISAMLGTVGAERPNGTINSTYRGPAIPPLARTATVGNQVGDLNTVFNQLNAINNHRHIRLRANIGDFRNFSTGDQIRTQLFAVARSILVNANNPGSRCPCNCNRCQCDCNHCRCNCNRCSCRTAMSSSSCPSANDCPNASGWTADVPGTTQKCPDQGCACVPILRPETCSSNASGAGSCPSNAGLNQTCTNVANCSSLGSSHTPCPNASCNNQAGSCMAVAPGLCGAQR